MSAIHYSAFNGDLYLLRLLIKHGGDVHQINDTGMSAL